MSDSNLKSCLLKQVSHYHGIDASAYSKQDSVVMLYNVILSNKFLKRIKHFQQYGYAKIEKGIFQGIPFQ